MVSPLHQIPKQFFLQSLGIRFHDLLELCHFVHCLPLTSAHIAQFLKRLHELGFFDGFEQIIAHAMLDRCLRILKMCIPTDDHNLQLWLGFFGFCNKIQAMTTRHTNVGNQNIGRVFVDSFKCFQTIASRCHHLHPQRFPIGKHLN